LPCGHLLGLLFRVHHGEVLQRLSGTLRAIGPHGALSLSLLGFNGVDDTWQRGKKTGERLQTQQLLSQDHALVRKGALPCSVLGPLQGVGADLGHLHQLLLL
jgi:hypothetical protein